ncbi:hypothetical protein [Hyphomonas sp.]|uniref:hypothetical protein n=1 Tax=Hyphomonas sp. TaxID=87 RepID=UPI00391B7489
MWKQALAGAALTGAGALKFSQTLAEAGREAELAAYLAFRCGAAETGSDPLTHSLLGLAPHCWGCYAMAIGAGLMLFALVRLPERLSRNR